jgi:D-psicose/D-tagatose/L-ribulose 3-epimerase
MKFGINTFLWNAHFGAEQFPLLPAVREHGFDGVELPLLRPREFQSAAIRRELTENALGCTTCSVLPGGVSLIAEEAEVRRNAITYVTECIARTAEAGGSLLVGPLYSPVGYLPGRRRNADEWKRAVECYQELGPVLQQHGVHVALEPLNRFETYFLNTTADAVQLCAEIAHPNVGILWDTFHANIEEKNIADALRLAAPFLKHVHTCENDRGTPGTGHVDWPGVFAALRDLQYDGWLTIESFGFAQGEVAAAASIWRDLAPTPDEIAWKGVEFLKASVIKN